MTLLYFADTRFPIERANGAQTMATCHALARRGHDIQLFVRPDTAASPRDPFAFYGLEPTGSLRIETINATGDHRTKRMRFLLSAASTVASTPGAVVFTRDLGVASFLAQLPLPRRPRLIYESHGFSPVVSAEMPGLLGQPGLAPSARKLRRLERRERRVWKRARAYVTLTRLLADELVDRYGPRDHVFVVPDGAHVPDVPAGGPPSPPGGVAGARPIAAYAGHLYPWKGVDVFVQALALAPGIAGLIVGGHPDEPDRARLQSLAQVLGVESRLEITGQVPPPEVLPRLQQASMLVLPNTASAISERYTSPLKLFEYLTLGRPIIASDLPALREVLTDGETALLIPAGDRAALADALIAIAADSTLAAALGSAARKLAPEYSWARRAERLEAAIAAAGAP